MAKTIFASVLFHYSRLRYLFNKDIKYATWVCPLLILKIGPYRLVYDRTTEPLKRTEPGIGSVRLGSVDFTEPTETYRNNRYY